MAKDSSGDWRIYVCDFALSTVKAVQDAETVQGTPGTKLWQSDSKFRN